jgi:hypothetical protein
MEFGWIALWFIVAVSLLVTVHEFGHFWVARKLGFKVLRFSVGFGKPLLKRSGARRITRNMSSPRCRWAATYACWTSAMARCRPATCRAPSPAGRLAAHPGAARRARANILFAVIVLWGMFWVNGIVPRARAGRQGHPDRRPPWPAAGRRRDPEIDGTRCSTRAMRPSRCSTA